MKCKDCNSTLCSYRTLDSEKDCFYETHPNYPMPIDLWNNDNTDWQALRNQAAIAAMQGLLCAPSYKADNDKLNMIAKDAKSIADALIEELKEK